MTIQTRLGDTKPGTVTTGPITGSHKVYASPEGRPDITVPFREIPLDPSANEAPFRTYDTSGPYTDPYPRQIDLESRPGAHARRLDRAREASPCVPPPPGAGCR